VTTAKPESNASPGHATQRQLSAGARPRQGRRARLPPRWCARRQGRSPGPLPCDLQAAEQRGEEAGQELSGAVVALDKEEGVFTVVNPLGQ
jgi:hypothetical protein